jgi:hypothetical protein
MMPVSTRRLIRVSVPARSSRSMEMRAKPMPYRFTSTMRVTEHG